MTSHNTITLAATLQAQTLAGRFNHKLCHRIDVVTQHCRHKHWVDELGTQAPSLQTALWKHLRAQIVSGYCIAATQGILSTVVRPLMLHGARFSTKCTLEDAIGHTHVRLKPLQACDQ
jgi:hypothetical protein